MRVMQVVSRLGTVGGTEMYVRRLTEQLLGQGHETTVVTCEPPGPADFPVVQVADFTRPGGPGQAQILERLDVERPDVVLGHSTANGPLLAALNARVPTAEFMHAFLCAGAKLFRRNDTACTHPLGPRCLWDWYAGPCGTHGSPRTAWESHQQALQYRDALRGLPAALVLTDYMRDYLIGDGVAPERIHVAQSDLGIAPERPVGPPGTRLLFVGRVVYNKGVQYVLQALTLLGPEYRLTVVGDGWYLPELKALAARLGVADRVTWTGTLRGEALEARYREADVALAPSIWPEPAGLVVPEARAHGLPVVAFDIGGLREWGPRYGYAGLHMAAPVTADAFARSITEAARGLPPAPPGFTVTPARTVADILAQTAEQWNQEQCKQGRC